jgi:hypothetical protein
MRRPERSLLCVECKCLSPETSVCQDYILTLQFIQPGLLGCILSIGVYLTAFTAPSNLM